MPLTPSPPTAPRTDMPIGTGPNTVASGNDPRLVGALQARSNLTDLSSPLDAREALGLGSAAVLDRDDLCTPADVARAVDALRTELTARLDQLQAAITQIAEEQHVQARDYTAFRATPVPDPGLPALHPRPVRPVPPIGNGSAGIRIWSGVVTQTVNDLRLILKALNLVE